MVTWWGWAVGAVLVLYPCAIWGVLRLAVPRPVDGVELELKDRVLHVWRDGRWVPVEPAPNADDTIGFTLRFQRPECVPSRPRPLHCRDVWRPM